MKPILLPLRRLLLQLMLLMFIYLLSRICFTVINLKYFHDLSPGGFFRLCLYATRYDLAGILSVNAVYVLLLLFPVPAWNWPRWQRFVQIVFITINSVALAFELSDWAYYPYNFKRSTASVLDMITRKGDFFSLLPTFIVDYWYVPIALVLLITGFVKINKKICKHTPVNEAPAFIMSSLIPFWQTIQLVLVTGLCIVGIRGGMQYIPINLRNALQVTESKYVPVLVNTPFSIISTMQMRELEELNYYSEAEAKRYFDPVKQYHHGPFSKKNVVLIILESYSKEFTKLGGTASYTPFLDSLMDHAHVCTAAYANALHSDEGVPAVISGIPSLMEEALINSPYGANKITALPGVLKKEGYSSAFYHGGTNGTMSFDLFCASAGYDKYFGRNEYNNDADYDGNWGIWDEPFLQFFEQGINKLEPPFMATVFTLSSHPPFKLPKEYEGKFPGTLPVHTCVGYTDMALKKFFAAASKESWYNNTLFIITADHCSPASEDDANNHASMAHYAIPILYYAPGDVSINGYDSTITQQLDILPSALDYLGYDKKFYAAGNSIFSPAANRFLINQLNGAYQWVMRDKMLKTVEAAPRGLYAFPRDINAMNNMLNGNERFVADSMLPYFKSFLQRYRNDLIHNKLSVE